jgi:hypothetical protein
VENNTARDVQTAFNVTTMQQRTVLKQAALAPASLLRISSSRDTAPTAFDMESPAHTFAGAAISSVTDNKSQGRGRDKASRDFPVTTTDQLEHLSDAELFQIFHKGTAEIPSDLPGRKGVQIGSQVTLLRLLLISCLYPKTL